MLPSLQLFPPSWQLLHLHLDIHWSVLEILHLLEQRMAGMLHLLNIRFQITLCSKPAGTLMRFVDLVVPTGQIVYAHQFVNLTGETLTNISLLEDQVNNLLCDLIGLAMNKYNKVIFILV